MGSADDVDELRFGVENFGDSGRNRTSPSWACDQKSTSVIAAGAGAKVIEVEAIKVHHLENPVAPLLDGRNGKDNRFGAQVKTEEGVRSIGVGGHERRILRSKDASETEWGVEGPFVLGITLIDGESVHGEVSLDHGIAVDVRIFGYGLDFSRRNCALWHKRTAILRSHWLTPTRAFSWQ